jgi:hypothetical protein
MRAEQITAFLHVMGYSKPHPTLCPGVCNAGYFCTFSGESMPHLVNLAGERGATGGGRRGARPHSVVPALWPRGCVTCAARLALGWCSAGARRAPGRCSAGARRAPGRSSDAPGWCSARARLVLAVSRAPPASFVKHCTHFGGDIFNILDISVGRNAHKVCEVTSGRLPGRVGPWSA